MKKTYKVNGMHCTSCAMVIESDLEDAGITSKVSYANQTLEVETDDAVIPEEKIRKVVSSAGYSIQ
jgi:copper chaperone CopZ